MNIARENVTGQRVFHAIDCWCITGKDAESGRDVYLHDDMVWRRIATGENTTGKFDEKRAREVFKFFFGYDAE